MLLALEGNSRVGASPGGRAACPSCRDEVIAKCGPIVTWHWAHRIEDCDYWSEPESEWHRQWKLRFPEDWREVVVGDHRADVKTPHLVLELQASALPVEEIHEREKHYGRMVWLLKGEDFSENLDIRDRGRYVTFRWRWPRKSWWRARRPLVIDLSADQPRLLRVRKLHDNLPCGGWGEWLTIERFMSWCGCMEGR